MKRRVSMPWLLSLPLLLAACTGPSTPPLESALKLGTELSAPVSAKFTGRWTVTRQPDWLSVTPSSGEGDIAFTVTANRSAGTPLTADQAQLSGVVTVEWQRGASTTGAMTVNVTADQYRLSGQVADTARVTGQDQHVTAFRRVEPVREARGVLVKYRAAAASTLSAQDLKGKSAAARGRDTLTAAGLRVTGAREVTGQLAALNVPDVPAALKALRADPNVEYAVPNAVLRAQQATLAEPVTPTDQYAPLQWPYRLMGYPAVWRDMENAAYTRPVTVAVLDSGVRFDHPDLAGQLWGPGEGALDVLPFKPADSPDYDNGDGDGPDTDPTDPSTPGRAASSHGTHVTGIIAARWGDNSAPGCAGCSVTGVAGATYRAPVKVLPVRVLDASGSGTEEDVIQALRYAAGLPVTLAGVTYRTPHPAQVINLSLGNPMSEKEAAPMCEAVRDAAQAGALVIVAAGNGYGTSPYYPAACPDAVAVGSVTLSGGSAPRHAPYSNTYPQVQLSAPGGTDTMTDVFNGGKLNNERYPDMIFSTDWNYEKNTPEYDSMSGTSQAAPQVSALAALLLSKGVTSDAASTLERLKATATDLGAAGRDDLFGVGMVNAAAALGAPAVSDTLGLRLQDARGQAFQPKLDALGRFEAFLGDGTFTVTGGRDRNANGVYGESGEPQETRGVTLGPAAPRADVGTLTPQ